MPVRRCRLLSSRAHALAQLGVEIREGLVEQQDRRLDHQRRASATRCCWPPLSWPGWRPSSPSRPTAASIRVDTLADLCARALREPKAEGDVVEHRHVRPDGIVLEHHAHPAPLRRHHVSLARTEACPATRIVPSSGSRKPASTRRVVVLPQPEGPRKVTNSCLLNRQAQSRSARARHRSACAVSDLDERHARLDPGRASRQPRARRGSTAS